MGNNEVGHMNIGAGRVVYQDLLRIDRAVADGSFATEPTLQEALGQAKKPGVRLRLWGSFHGEGCTASKPTFTRLWMPRKLQA